MECLLTLAAAIIILIAILSRLGRKPERKQRRPPFKVRHDLDRRQPLGGFEKKLARAMFAEGREVFVAVFCTETEVLRVTATVGSTMRCRASDRVELWGEKATQLGATQVRWYHNHPDVFGRSVPSRVDRNTKNYLRQCVEPWEVRFVALLVYKTYFGGYRVKEY